MCTVCLGFHLDSTGLRRLSRLSQTQSISKNKSSLGGKATLREKRGLLHSHTVGLQNANAPIAAQGVRRLNPSSFVS